jgi:hypothetical protein
VPAIGLDLFSPFGPTVLAGFPTTSKLVSARSHGWQRRREGEVKRSRRIGEAESLAAFSGITFKSRKDDAD